MTISVIIPKWFVTQIVMLALVMIEPLSTGRYVITFTDGHRQTIKASYCEKEYGNTLLECFYMIGDDVECSGGWMLNTIKSIEPVGEKSVDNHKKDL